MYTKEKTYNRTSLLKQFTVFVKQKKDAVDSGEQLNVNSRVLIIDGL